MAPHGLSPGPGRPRLPRSVRLGARRSGALAEVSGAHSRARSTVPSTVAARRRLRWRPWALSVRQVWWSGRSFLPPAVRHLHCDSPNPGTRENPRVRTWVCNRMLLRSRAIPPQPNRRRRRPRRPRVPLPACPLPVVAPSRHLQGTHLRQRRRPSRRSRTRESRTPREGPRVSPRPVRAHRNTRDRCRRSDCPRYGPCRLGYHPRGRIGVTQSPRGGVATVGTCGRRIRWRPDPGSCRGETGTAVCLRLRTHLGRDSRSRRSERTEGGRTGTDRGPRDTGRRRCRAPSSVVADRGVHRIRRSRPGDSVPDCRRSRNR